MIFIGDVLYIVIWLLDSNKKATNTTIPLSELVSML